MVRSQLVYQDKPCDTGAKDVPVDAQLLDRQQIEREQRERERKQVVEQERIEREYAQKRAAAKKELDNVPSGSPMWLEKFDNFYCRYPVSGFQPSEAIIDLCINQKQEGRARRAAELEQQRIEDRAARATAASRVATLTNDELKKKLEGQILKILIDPYSAQFSDERFSWRNEALCGRINSKNRYGGYVGAKRFGSTITGEVAIEDERKGSDDPWRVLNRKFNCLD